MNDPIDAELARESSLIFDFLGGGFVRKPDSKQEHEARKLLAERLRHSPMLDLFIRWRLAAMIDPDDGELWKLVVKPRRKKLPQRQRDGAIAWSISGWLIVGKKSKKWAVAAVMREYGVSKTTVNNAWRKYGDKAIAAHHKIHTTSPESTLRGLSDAYRKPERPVEDDL